MDTITVANLLSAFEKPLFLHHVNQRGFDQIAKAKIQGSESILLRHGNHFPNGAEWKLKNFGYKSEQVSDLLREESPDSPVYILYKYGDGSLHIEPIVEVKTYEHYYSFFDSNTTRSKLESDITLVHQFERGEKDPLEIELEDFKKQTSERLESLLKYLQENDVDPEGDSHVEEMFNCKFSIEEHPEGADRGGYVPWVTLNLDIRPEFRHEARHSAYYHDSGGWR